MLRLTFLLAFLISLVSYSQSTNRYTGDYARYYTAEDLFEKEKYSAAREEFEIFMKELGDREDPLFVKAKYYHALSALKLYHADAEKLLLGYLQEYPESVHRQSIYMELGRFYYRKKKYDKTINWLAKIDLYDVEEENRGEYYFKLGYSYFREGESKKARDAFYEIIELEGQYQAPSIYYYSHIAYQEKNYQTALEGFEKLTDDPAFKKAVPYYITQIYYLQGNYDKLLDYAPAVVDSADVKNEVSISHLIGDAYYKVGKYDEAVPFLEEYNNKSATTRDEDYQLGYAYYKSGAYNAAIKMFDRVAQERDELGQVASYHIGECYLKQDNFLYARNAFEKASTLPFDADIEEDALYNYAVLSYKLDFNPFDEALEALNLYLTRYPNSKRNKDIYQYLINVYTTMRNYKSALSSMDEIPEKDFKMKSAYQMMAYNYGVELYENSQYGKSIQYFELVKKYPIDPKLNAQSLYWIAEAHYRKKKYDEAILSYRQFLEEPGSYGLEYHNDAYYNIAYCYFRLKDYESATQNFRTFTQDENETNKEKITDAYLRIGDCYFAKQPADDDNAIVFYEKAIANNGGQIDYAKYQIGLSYGYKKEYESKAQKMLDIVNNHSSSTFAVPALYEAGEAYRLMDDQHHAKAMKLYNQLIIDYPTHPRVIDAIFQIGVLHFKEGNYALAEKQYLRVINEFDDPVKEKDAISALEYVYKAMNQPDKYLELLNKMDIDFDATYEDNLRFDNAMKLYEDSSYAAAIPAFESYLNKFDKPLNQVSAWYHLATCHDRLEQWEMAIPYYEKLLSQPTNSFTEYAALKASAYRYEREEYDIAVGHYQQLEATASFPENKLIAQIGLMRCYTFRKEFDVAKNYANKVLLDPLSLENVQIEAHYVLGKAEMEVGNYDLALPEFVEVSENTASIIGAESQYYVALIYHLKEEYKQSETEVRKLMKEKAGYDFWVAKVLILQAKNSIGIEDYVQAEYTLNSVLNGYTIEDDGIYEEVYQVQAVLEELKNPEKDIDDEEDDTIEIGDGDGE
ncbi:MAG: tetratricopeptide repeat protein [Flavobacteriales bacterium]|nr:tetratricopeptide repeat protein [Flavobacteriales bacterium]